MKQRPILSLLTLALALAALPALGQEDSHAKLQYLKKNYNYLEKIPIKNISASFNNEGRPVTNLLDNDKNTEWISWTENVIWEETYSQARYFTGTAIDGGNNTTSTIDNNTLSLQEAGSPWRQFHVLSHSASNELKNLKAGNYFVTMRFRGDVIADGGNVFLGRTKGQNEGDLKTEYQIPIGTVSTEWTEKTFAFTIDNDIDNAFCAIQPGSYKGTLEVDWADLSYEEVKVELPNISGMSPDKYDYGEYSFLTLENGCIDTYKTDDWYQFRLTDYFGLVSGYNYRVRLQMKGTESGKLVLWCGPFSGKIFDVPTDNINEVEIELGICSSSTNGTYMAIQTSDLDNKKYNSYLGHIIIKQVILEHKDESGNWVADKTVDYKDCQNWPLSLRSGNDYIPALVEKNGKTVAKITHPGNNDYSFRLAYNVPIPKGKYTFKINIDPQSINSNSERDIHLMIGSINGPIESSFKTRLNSGQQEYIQSGIELNGRDDYWIVCQPCSGIGDGQGGNYTGNFTIESVELINENPVQESFTIKNEGTTVYAGDAGHQEIKTIQENDVDNSIIYSHPLPQTRKVLLAVGDAAHAGEQYLNKNSLALTANRKYTVSFKIKASGNATAKIAFADFNGGTAIGESSEFEFGPGDYEEVWTTVTPTQNAESGAVVLDLGYYLGSVDIQDLKVYDNYNPDMAYHTSKTQTIATQTANTPSTENDYFRTQQFFAGRNLQLQPQTNHYKATVKLKATSPGKLCMKLGGWGSWEPRYIGYEDFSSNLWEDVNFDCVDNEKFNTNMSGSLTLQLVGPNNIYDKYNGDVNIRSVALYSYNSDDWQDGNPIHWNISGNNEYPYYAVDGNKPTVANGVLTANPIPGTYYQFLVMDNVEFTKGRSYKLRATIKGNAAPAGNYSNQIEVMVGGWKEYENNSTTFTFTSNWQDIEIELPPSPVDKGMVLFKPKNNGEIQIHSLRIVPNTNETVVGYWDYTGDNHDMAIPTGISISPETKSYDKLQIYDANDGLFLEPQGNEIEVIDGIRFDVGRSYRTEFDINVSHPGKYLVTIGDVNDSQSQVITVDDGEAGAFVRKSADFSTLAAENGRLTVTPMGYTRNLAVTNATLSTATPEYDGSSIIGTDFFQIELDDNYALDQDGKYQFHFGYGRNSNRDAKEATPKKFVIMGCEQPYGAYKRLGSYEVEVSENGNGFINAIDNPLKIDSSWGKIKYLRFVCTDNEGPSNGISIPKKEDGSGANDENNAYTGYMIRMTRFGIYKQTSMFATDKANPAIGTALNDATFDRYTKWAMPVVTRYQIEALGQKYAYPGANLNDMLSVNKSADITGELFDNDITGGRYDRISYWDTTLPLLKNEANADDEIYFNAENDKYQYIDYDSFTYPEDDDHNRNYDCIDLLLPDMGELDAVKKLNGKENTNGYYQVVVSMSRSHGPVDEYNNRMRYEDESEDFLNRANGFPMEISYQGITIGDDYTKTVTPIEKTERVLTFPTVAAGDSIRFALKVEKGWSGVRIFCRENTGNIERRAGGVKKTNVDLTANDGDRNGSKIRVVDVKNNDPVPGTRIMRLGEIRAYVELNKIDLETPEGRKRYDLLYNNREDFNTRKWKHTRGIIDAINNVNSVHGTTDEQFMKTGDGGQTWADVIDTYKDYFDEQGIEYPDFRFLNNPLKDENVVSSNGLKRNLSDYEGQQRQRTYTILHEVLALPGERVDLYPQSDIWMHNGHNYEEQFVRWYDYLTDKAPDFLYFFVDPRCVIKTEEAGFIGGKTLLGNGLRGKGTVASVYFNETNPNADWAYEENGVKKMKDQWVAADFSLAFNNNLQERLGRKEGQKGDEIVEPIINFRHLFHITSGSVFADRYMATAEGNRHYAKSNRRYISALTGKKFHIRLEEALPMEENVKSSYYYRTGTEGSYKYQRVRGCDIYTYKLGENVKSDDVIKDIRFSTGNDSDDLKDTAEGAKHDMFVMDIDSKFTHANSFVQTTAVNDPERWLRNATDFARSIKCDINDIEEGRYLVRIYGKDADGKLIHLKSEDGTEDVPLVIAEYEVEFLGDLYASFIPENELDKLPENKHHHTEEYLEEHYGDGKSDSKAVNFDKYTVLKQKNVIVNKGEAPVNFYRYGFFEEKTWGNPAWRLKLPIAWDNSNYGFGYATAGDYNMFRLADNSVITPYNTAANKKNDNPVDPEYNRAVEGTYDRLFYNTGGKEKGLFYYVNAAADPGEMVKIDFDYLCPGSTIYVSAWVNEFNEGQPETANVIFNFYANVAKEVNGEKEIVRQEQIHGFATGYVEEGDQGKWMHAYYSFVPDPSHADVVAADHEYIDSYYLVLENNCLSSSGADYAIDDIRAYVVAPRVDASQSNSLCEKDDVKIDIQVQLPLEALETSLAGQADEEGKVYLQYSIVDKVTYDDTLEAILNEHKEEQSPYVLTTDDHYKAFAAGVLHYKHTNIKTDSESGKVDYPLSWGVIEFYMDYKNKKDSDIIKVNGRTMTVGDYKKTYFKKIDGEDCFVFVTHPVSETEEGEVNYNEFERSHRDYYVVVDNVGTTNVFASLFYQYDENGNLIKDSEDKPVLQEKYKDCLGKPNADVYPRQTNDEGEYEKSEEWEAYDIELAKAFQICTDCARMAEFSLKGSAQIVIDGVLYDNDDNITCCENQRPVVQINLKTKKLENGIEDTDAGLQVKEGSELTENPFLDWWCGPFEEFAEATSEILGSNREYLTLWDILDYFRTDYPYAETWDVPTVEEKKQGETKPEKYSNAMRSYLKQLCATEAVVDGEVVPVEPKLILHRSSYVFPQSSTVLVDDNGKKLKSKEIFVTAIPPATPTEIEEDDVTYVICTQPREVKITVSNTSPTLFNGFNEIKYPKEIEDVPLRIGLKQLDLISEGTSGENLYVPLRNINPATYDVEQFKRKTGDYKVYLVETNDTKYRKFSDMSKLDPKESDDYYHVETRTVGEVVDVIVKFTRDASGGIKITDMPLAQIVFEPETDPVSGKKLPTGITFREGYYYKFKFNFEEGESVTYQQPGFEKPCAGQTVFTIKVVPEYQVWTGEASLNWNNDENWRRVSTDDLLATRDAPSAKASDRRFTTDGSNNQAFSYAPLNFTKVIIPAGTTYPQLAAHEHGRIDGGSSTVAVNNGHGGAAADYVWVADAPNAYKQGENAGNSVTVGDANSSSYHPTLYVQYDMAATTYDADNNVYCRPWYANACEQIHFDSNAEILNQQYLDYEKAWVDMEMAPHRWYNVASPLYGVAAGDMYLPSVGTETPGRQMTELFTPINYDKVLNDRFAPAVYQRGWDKGRETVYILHDDGSTGDETVALASTWSHVYNDVAEEYAPGMGYSVKTDVTRLLNFQGEAAENEKQTLVKFRFPKADTSYYYFEDGSTTENNYKDLSPIREDKEGRLFEMTGTEQTVTLTKAHSGNLFLVGNPFMAHIDMAKFIEKNSSVIEPKYWLLSEGTGQTGVVMVHDKENAMLTNETLKSGDVTATSSNTDQLAPMQGFFVQAKEAGEKLTIKFTPDMMAVQAYTDQTGAPILKAPAAPTRADGDDIIRVSTEESTAIIRLSGSAKKGYAASEDVEMIDDSNQRGIRRIYTVAGTMASAINQTPDADGVEVGLMAPTDSVTVVTFNGVALEDYLLYDTATGEKTQLYDGFELEVTGSVSGRYYLTNGVDTVEIEDASIRIMPLGHEVVVKAPAVCGELTVRVFDTLGREVAKAEGFEQEVRIPLEQGIYVVKATGSEAGHKTAKLSIQ